MSASEAYATTDGLQIFKAAASNPTKAAAILQDGTCLGAFVLGLDNHDGLVIEILEVVLELLKHAPGCKNNVRESLGMEPQLDKLRSRPKSQVTELAQQLYDELTKPDNALEELEKTLAIATNPAMAATVIKDESFMESLIVLLSNPDTKVLYLTLKIFNQLSETYDNRIKIRDMRDIPNKVHNLFHSSCPDVAELSQNIYEKLTQPEPLQDRTNISQKEKTRRRRNSFFLGNVAKSKMVVLQIRGMNDRYDADAARNSLLHVKGVISITCDLKEKRIILRTKPELKTELVGEAIARTMTMVAEQVLKDEDGNEVLVPFNLHSTVASADKENEDMPDYPDEPSPVKGDQNMARIGEVTPAKDKAFKFVQSVGSFLTNSFYW